MKRIVVLLLAALAALGVAIPVVLLRGGVSARTEPSRLEAAVARRVRGWAIPGSARELSNPVPTAPAVLADARAHWADHCAVCHAADGGGDTPIGRNLYPRAPDLRQRETQALTDGELFWIIENGVRLTGMPAFGGAGKPEESWKLVRFIRTLPQLTPAERAEIERLVPRSPQEWQELREEDEFLRGADPGTDAAPHAH